MILIVKIEKLIPSLLIAKMQNNNDS